MSDRVDAACRIEEERYSYFSRGEETGARALLNETFDRSLVNFDGFCEVKIERSGRGACWSYAYENGDGKIVAEDVIVQYFPGGYRVKLRGD